MLSPIKPVTLSKRAVEEVNKIMKTKNIPGEYGLRIGIRGSGCGGASLIIGFDKQRDSDLSYQVDGLTIYVDKKHTLYVMGKEVDFYEGADKRGFMFLDTPTS